jgi:hypothetical protein
MNDIAMNENELSDNNPINEHIDESIIEAVSFDTKEKSDITNKRIDFSSRTLKRIETMIPVYSDELSSSASKNDIMALVIAKGIDALFDGDFKRKINEL